MPDATPPSQAGSEEPPASGMELAEVQEYLVAFYTWRDATKLTPEYLQACYQQYGGREAQLLDDLGKTVPFCQGWADARRALKHFFTGHPDHADKVDSVDDIMQKWFKDNHSEIVKHGPQISDYVPGGHFEKFYAFADKEYNTKYFSQRQTLIELHEDNEPNLAPQLKYDLDAELTACGPGKEKEVMDKHKAAYDKERKARAKWLERFYGKHAPERIDNIDSIIKSRPGKVGFELLQHTLFRKYDVDRYTKAATYGPDCAKLAGKPWDVKNALIEFYSVHDQNKLLLIHEILDTLEDREAMVEELLSIYEPEYAPVYKENKADGKKVLFPPWRNIDYPRVKMPDAYPDPPGDTIMPQRGEEQPDLKYLDPEEYPDLEELRRKEQERLQMEAEEGDARQRMEDVEKEQFDTLLQLAETSLERAGLAKETRKAEERADVEKEEAKERQALADAAEEDHDEYDKMFREARDSILGVEAAERKRKADELEAERRAKKTAEAVEEQTDREARNRKEVAEAQERAWTHLLEEDARGRGRHTEFLEKKKRDAEAAALKEKERKEKEEAARKKKEDEAAAAARAEVEDLERAAREAMAAEESDAFKAAQAAAEKAGPSARTPPAGGKKAGEAGTAANASKDSFVDAFGMMSSAATLPGSAAGSATATPRDAKRAMVGVPVADNAMQTDLVGPVTAASLLQLKAGRRGDGDDSSVGIPVSIAPSEADASGSGPAADPAANAYPAYTAPLPFPPPRRFWVSSPHLVAPRGMYVLEKQAAYCGAPYWVQAKARHVIYLNGWGRWTVGKNEEMLDDGGWARATTRNDSCYPDQFEYEVKDWDGWDVDPCFHITRHPFAERAQGERILRCMRCAGNRTRLQEQRSVVEGLWKMVNEGQGLRYMQGDTSGLDPEAPKAQLASMERALLEEMAKTPELDAEWARLRRTANHDDIGHSLDAVLLEKTEKALALSRRRVEKLLAAVGGCVARRAADRKATAAERAMCERLSEDMGTLMLTTARDEKKAGVAPSKLESLQRKLRRHEKDYGIPPMLCEEELEEAYIPHASRLLLEEQAARVLPRASLLPTQKEAIQKHVVEQTRAIHEKDARIRHLHRELVSSMATRDERLRTLQAQLDAAHVALGITPARNVWPAPRDPATGYLAAQFSPPQPQPPLPPPDLSPPRGRVTPSPSPSPQRGVGSVPRAAARPPSVHSTATRDFFMF